MWGIGSALSEGPPDVGSGARAVRPKVGRRRRMGSIGRYIFRTTFGAFLLVLVSLTGAIWITQALRDVDLMTSQGQTILVFIGITSLIIPHLVMVIAPVALVVAVVPHPAQARHRFRNHRDERRRHAAVGGC